MKKEDASEMSRRAFLATAAAAASAPLLGAANRQDLAVEGGRPVRSTPLTTDYEGANFIGTEEKKELDEAVETRSLFRFYGFSQPQKARTFEGIPELDWRQVRPGSHVGNSRTPRGHQCARRRTGG